jgi:hypothetical protein
MSEQRLPFLNRFWSLAALAGLVWALIGLAYASLAPSADIPRVFQNYHIEHFAAFYVVALLSAMALPHVRMMRIGLVLCCLAAAFALFRVLALINRVFYVEDLACDISGTLAALVPILLGGFRRTGTI